MTCNNMEAVLAAAIGCMGLAWMPDFLAADALADGRLQRVLPALPTHQGSSRCYGPVGAIPVHACGCSSTTPLRIFSAAPGKGDGGLSRLASCAETT
jgi:hypothetical protein